MTVAPAVRELPTLAERTFAAPSSSFDAPTLTAAVSGRLIRIGRLPISGGAVDSRRVEPGNAFFALPGARTDGHRFLADAARNGAAALVISQASRAAEVDEIAAASSGEGPAIVLVEDGLAALHAAAAAWRARFQPLVVGVTGSLAKTSTKEQIAEVLGQRLNVLRSRANENNEIGLPLTLLRLGPEHEVAVLEMGMYEPGDIAVLARLAEPQIGVVTAVRGAHLVRAGSIDAIERGKRELIDALPAGGTAVLNVDDPRVARMADTREGDLNVLRYGFDKSADVSARDIVSRAGDGMSFTLTARDEEIAVESPALGRHSVHNALAAAAVGLAAGMSLPDIAAGLTRPFSVPHRSILIRAGEWQLLDDTYNAAPDSMRAALDLLASLPGRHVAVLGEMLELGPQSDAEHRAVGSHAAQTTDVLVAVGATAHLYAEGARNSGMSTAAINETVDRDAALAQLERVLLPGDVVLVKASRGAELDLLVDQLRQMASAEPIA